MRQMKTQFSSTGLEYASAVRVHPMVQPLSFPVPARAPDTTWTPHTEKLRRFYPQKINKSSYFDKMTRYIYCLTIYGLWLRPALSRFPMGITAIQAGTEAIPYEIGNFPADASPGPVAGVERVALRRQMSSGQPTGRWRASPMATGAALGSEWPERSSQRRFGRAIQFC